MTISLKDTFLQHASHILKFLTLFCTFHFCFEYLYVLNDEHLETKCGVTNSWTCNKNKILFSDMVIIYGLRTKKTNKLYYILVSVWHTCILQRIAYKNLNCSRLVGIQRNQMVQYFPLTDRENHSIKKKLLKIPWILFWQLFLRHPSCYKQCNFRAEQLTTVTRCR